VDYKDFARYGGEIQSALKTEKIDRVVLGTLDGDMDRWFRANVGWLREKWILGNKRAVEDPEPKIISRSGLREPEIKLFYTQVFITQWNISKAVGEVSENKLEEHIWSILRSAVFGAMHKATNPGGFREPIRYMSGFLEQVARLPTPADPVEMRYLAGNGIMRWLDHRVEGETHRIISECCLIAK